MPGAELIPLAKTRGTEVTRFNSLKHGILSRYTVLPWENEGEYSTLVDALIEEHGPQGPTEEHLVEELAGVMWRKRRLRLAEAAAQRHGFRESTAGRRETVKAALVHFGLGEQIESVIDSIRASEADTRAVVADLDEDEAMTRQAMEILDSPRSDIYETALGALRSDTREWWETEGRGAADPTGLRRFLESKVLPWFENRRKELENRPLIREQVFGEAFDAPKLERLARYETHLDRKLERTLAMLVRLKDLRQEPCST